MSVTDPRTSSWELRQVAIEHLALLRVYRDSVCGCSRCGDETTGAQLDTAIAKNLAAIARYSERVLRSAG